MSKYIRHQAIISRQSESYIDEDNWLYKLEKSLEKSAVQPRTIDQSIFDQISSIMNNKNKSKHTSVEAAVEDMKNRSGLTAYLKNINKTATKNDDFRSNELIGECKKAIKEKKWYFLGRYIAKIDMYFNNPHINGVESIRTLKYFKDPDISSLRIPLSDWAAYTEGYNEEWGLSVEEKKKDLEFTNEVIRNILNKTASDEKKNRELTPVVIVKCPDINKTIQNYIQSTRGNLPIPAIIDKIKSIHQSDVSNASDWEDDKLIRYISKLNLAEKSKNYNTRNEYNNLGKNDDSNEAEIDPSNVDAFHALNPVKF